jgi:glycerol-3-phosphate acyltransferase PlsY
MWFLIVLLCSYLIGSVPFSFIVAKRVKGVDLRRIGSGNLGATNIVRTLGPGWGVLVLLLDMGKGALAVLLMTAVVGARPEGQPLPLHLPPDVFRILAGFLAALGHTLSPFVSFHGGKGVATTSGAFFILAPYPTLTALAVFGVVFAVTRIVSLGSLCAAAVLPVAVAFFEWHSPQFSKTIFFFTLVICIWVIHRHRANIERWQRGKEQPLVPANNHGPKQNDTGANDSQAGKKGRS